MPKKPTRKQETGMQDVRVSLPCEDADIWEWLKNQKSVSRSVYYLISEAVRTVGTRDVTMSGFHGRQVPAKYKPRASKPKSEAPVQPAAVPMAPVAPVVQPSMPVQPVAPKPQQKPKNDSLDSLLI